MRSSSTESCTVSDLVLDVLGTHRGCWMSVQEIVAVASRVRPSVNERTVEVVAPYVVASSSVERRVVKVALGRRDRWGNDGTLWDDVVELRIPW